MAVVSHHISILTLNINRMNSPIKQDTEWLDLLKNKAQLYAFCRKLTLAIKTNKLEVKGWKKTLQANGSQKKEDVVIFTLDKTDFKPKR